MNKHTIKFTSFQSLSNAVNGNKTNPDKWEDFLKSKGHTLVTFGYLPEPLQASLRFSFAKKSGLIHSPFKPFTKL